MENLDELRETVEKVLLSRTISDFLSLQMFGSTINRPKINFFISSKHLMPHLLLISTTAFLISILSLSKRDDALYSIRICQDEAMADRLRPT